MVSKIIEKEKERQEEIINQLKAFSLELDIDPSHPSFPPVFNFKIITHKQSLINLKEYMETFSNIHIQSDFYEQTQEDIEELNKMVEKYG